jgi:hypothetical protein
MMKNKLMVSFRSLKDVIETVENTSLNERVNAEKSIRKKALDKANEIATSINLIINNEENPDGLLSTKDLKNMRDEKKSTLGDKSHNIAGHMHQKSKSGHFQAHNKSAIK